MIEQISGLILAGGQARRMNGVDKGLQLLQGKPLYMHTLARLVPQVTACMISANRSLDVYRQSGLPVYTDSIAGYAGPLSGILTGLQQMPYDWLLCVPCDSPYLPLNLAEKFIKAKQQSAAQNCVIFYADDGERVHPTFCFIHRTLAPTLANYLQQGGRRMLEFMKSQQAIAVDFSEQKENFININTLEQLQQLN